MFGNHGLCSLPEEGAREKSPKCLGGNLGDFGGDFAKVSCCPLSNGCHYAHAPARQRAPPFFALSHQAKKQPERYFSGCLR